jgi:Ataxin-3
MHIARELDEKERQQMMALGTSQEGFLRFMAEDSGNVADDGNYSVQVLQKALQVWNIALIPLTAPEMLSTREHPE